MAFASRPPSLARRSLAFVCGRRCAGNRTRRWGGRGHHAHTHGHSSSCPSPLFFIASPLLSHRCTPRHCRRLAHAHTQTPARNMELHFSLRSRALLIPLFSPLRGCATTHRRGPRCHTTPQRSDHSLRHTHPRAGSVTSSSRHTHTHIYTHTQLAHTHTQPPRTRAASGSFEARKKRSKVGTAAREGREGGGRSPATRSDKASSRRGGAGRGGGAGRAPGQRVGRVFVCGYIEEARRRLVWRASSHPTRHSLAAPNTPPHAPPFSRPCEHHIEMGTHRYRTTKAGRLSRWGGGEAKRSETTQKRRRAQTAGAQTRTHTHRSAPSSFALSLSWPDRARYTCVRDGGGACVSARLEPSGAKERTEPAKEEEKGERRTPYEASQRLRDGHGRRRDPVWVTCRAQLRRGRGWRGAPRHARPLTACVCVFVR